MTSSTLRLFAVVVVAAVLAAPVASARPLVDRVGESTYQDLRNPDRQAPVPGSGQDLRNPDQRAPAPTPVVRTTPQPVPDDGGPSPIVFIAPAVALATMLGAAVLFTRGARRPARV